MWFTLHTSQNNQTLGFRVLQSGYFHRKQFNIGFFSLYKLYVRKQYLLYLVSIFVIYVGLIQLKVQLMFDNGLGIICYFLCVYFEMSSPNTCFSSAVEAVTAVTLVVALVRQVTHNFYRQYFPLESFSL